ncbi:hypothetical protein [Zoogloea sp.]|uniref:hypothetical protein n=1 Tax=Zoogloea sp. TaxID=49181 RepID=UPI0026394158|nr:hypothetical protein [Zoogloea sp.]MDD3354139.1 hypothetical protein [Zoogloea sp.]
MWTCLSDSVRSIVGKDDPSGQTLLVRARSKDDRVRGLENLTAASFVRLRRT